MPSASIRDYYYDDATGVLTVIFVTGRRYDYLDVPPEVFEAFALSGSKGGYFNAEIRDRFAYREVSG
jgi:KTSC domain